MFVHFQNIHNSDVIAFLDDSETRTNFEPLRHSAIRDISLLQVNV